MMEVIQMIYVVGVHEFFDNELVESLMEVGYESRYIRGFDMEYGLLKRGDILIMTSGSFYKSAVLLERISGGYDIGCGNRNVIVISGGIEGVYRDKLLSRGVCVINKRMNFFNELLKELRLRV